MADSYTIASVNTLFAANKCMISIFNAGSNVVRVYRIWALNNQTVAVTGVLTNLEVRRLTAVSGGTVLSLQTHDSTNAVSTDSITASTNPTFSSTDLFRRVIWSNDEPTGNATLTIDELECVVPLSCIWDIGYANSSEEPITLRTNEGVGVINTGATVGQVDLFMEITIASS